MIDQNQTKQRKMSIRKLGLFACATALTLSFAGYGAYVHAQAAANNSANVASSIGTATGNVALQPVGSALNTFQNGVQNFQGAIQAYQAAVAAKSKVGIMVANHWAEDLAQQLGLSSGKEIEATVVAAKENLAGQMGMANQALQTAALGAKQGMSNATYGATMARQGVQQGVTAMQVGQMANGPAATCAFDTPRNALPTQQVYAWNVERGLRTKYASLITGEDSVTKNGAADAAVQTIDTLPCSDPALGGTTDLGVCMGNLTKAMTVPDALPQTEAAVVYDAAANVLMSSLVVQNALLPGVDPSDPTSLDTNTKIALVERTAHNLAAASAVKAYSYGLAQRVSPEQETEARQHIVDLMKDMGVPDEEIEERASAVKGQSMAQFLGTYALAINNIRAGMPATMDPNAAAVLNARIETLMVWIQTQQLLVAQMQLDLDSAMALIKLGEHKKGLDGEASSLGVMASLR